MLNKLNIKRKRKPTIPSGVIVSKAVKNLDGNAPIYSEQDIVGRENRLQRIATAAYYRAEQRNFNSGGEIQDWLEAEAEIDKTP
jgi:hypothetical protein